MNTGQLHTHDSQSMASKYISQGLLKAKPTRLHTLCHFPLTYLLPVCAQAQPMQLGQLALFTEVKIHGWLYEQPQHSRKLSVLGQVGLTG